MKVVDLRVRKSQMEAPIPIHDVIGPACVESERSGRVYLVLRDGCIFDLQTFDCFADKKWVHNFNCCVPLNFEFVGESWKSKIENGRVLNDKKSCMFRELCPGDAFTCERSNEVRILARMRDHRGKEKVGRAINLSTMGLCQRDYSDSERVTIHNMRLVILDR